MEFYSVYGKRPVRLREETRQYAWDALHGKYGDEAMRYDSVSMDDVPGFGEMDEQAQYNAMIRKIVTEAPLRVHPADTVCGSATLGFAMSHVIPARFHGEHILGCISHVTLGFGRALELGVNGLAREVMERLRDPALTEAQRSVLIGMKTVTDAMTIWHGRYLEAVKDRPELYEPLCRVPMEPPRSFREALQSLWFFFSFERLCGNWPGIGRIDAMLGAYLKNDLKNGVLTLDEARELVAGFWIHGCEWVRSDPTPGTGDAQHYQNIVLAGVDEDGNEVANEVTALVLDVVEELGISDFPITVRVSDRTPTWLLRRMAEVMRHGGGIIAVYNEKLILDCFQKQGYALREARQFANDGCWEVQIPGKTYFTYHPIDALQLLLNDTMRVNTETPAHFDTYDALYAEFVKNLRKKVDEVFSDTCGTYIEKENVGTWGWGSTQPTSAIDLLEEGCLKKGKIYRRLGAEYTVLSPHIGGAPDTANALYAIRKLVFEDKKCDYDTLARAVADNWDGYEELRLEAKNGYTYYGNDSEECDTVMVKLINDFADIVDETALREPRVRFVSGISTFGRQIDWLPYRCATPFGAKKGDILAGNASPTPGTDVSGATAIIRSYCKLPLDRMYSGAALDVKLHPSAIRGETGAAALEALVEGFCTLGGFFMQVDIMDAEVLREAQLHPEQYKTLSVRVSGWNARFVTLCPKWQEMIIERTAQGV